MKQIIVAAAGLLVLVTTFVVLEVGARQDASAVTAALGKIENIEVIDVWGNEDVTLEDVYAVISVNGKGTITVLGVTPESIEESRHVRVAHIGQWEPDVLRVGQSGEAESERFDIDFGPDGGLSSELGIEVSSIGDLVRRYDEIASVLEDLPEIPQRAIFHTEDGQELRVGVRRTSKSRWQRESRGFFGFVWR